MFDSCGCPASFTMIHFMQPLYILVSCLNKVTERTIISNFIKRGNHYKYKKGAIQLLFLRKESKSAYARQNMIK